MALDDAGLDTALTTLFGGTHDATAAKNALKTAIQNYVKSAICNGSVSVSLAAVTSSPTGGPLIGAATATFTGSAVS